MKGQTMPRDHLGIIPAHQFPTPLDGKRARIKRAIGYAAVFALMALIGVMLGYSV